MVSPESRSPSSSSPDIPANLESDFQFVSRQLVMFPDLNAHGRLFGGRLMSWLDAGVAQVAMHIMGTTNIVTKKFGEMVFHHPGKIGDSVEIWCRVDVEGKSSITLDCRVLVRKCEDGIESVRQICHCSVVYVALDERGQPTSWKRTNCE